MFTIDDFFKILEYLKSGDLSDLESNTTALAKSEQSNTENLFTNKFDVSAFMSNDYKMLRSFLIDWYTANKTILVTQRKANDVFSLPKNHLNELLTSFGYNVELNNITRINEANLMLDLVNLYKIKGTPKALANILAYFGMNRLDVSEYYLQKNEDGNLIFRPTICIQNNPMGLSVNPSDLDFDLVTNDDPHWMSTRDEILSLFNNGDITFPIKSPYLGLRPLYFIDKELIFISAILSKKVKDEYDEYLLSSTLNSTEVNLTILKDQCSLLELYLICDWMIKLYDHEQTYYQLLYPPVLLTENDDYIICEQEDSAQEISGRIFRYMGDYDIATQINNIIDEYENLMNRPLNRDDRIIKYNDFENKFTDSFDNCFLKEFNSARDLLQTINVSIYNSINELVVSNKQEEVLISSMKDLSDWITANIGGDYSNFSTFGLGSNTLDYVKNIINFFKPYRARIFSLDSGYVVSNKLFDSITLEDNFIGPDFDLFFVDFDTADGLAGFLESSFNINRYIYSRPPNTSSKQIQNLYIDALGNVKCVYVDVESVGSSTYIQSSPPAGSYRILNIHLSIDNESNVPTLHIIYNDDPEIIDGVSSYIVSEPEVGFIVLGMFLDPTMQCVIEYDASHSSSYVNSREYYSRSNKDQGSLFDLGASSDWDTGKCIPYDSTSSDFYTSIYPTRIDMIDYINDKYNTHPSDATCYTYYEYDTDELGNITQIRTNGGFVDFDEGWTFDSGFNNDICQISILELG